MKLKTRIIIGFGMSILVPLLLFSATLYGLSHTKFAQHTKNSSEVVYDISVGESATSQTQVKLIAKDVLFTATIILVFTALSIGLWIYRSIATPLVRLKKATQNIKEGNLDFVLEVEGDDEFSELCRDFEEMRKRLKESAEEKVLLDKENKELISNISHDLKTPITAVKGYVEGIMDGVADTPEKMDRYVKTIYNKTNEMDHLINELTFYSKIDTNRIPYTFSKLHVEDYFSDCAEDEGLEKMESLFRPRSIAQNTAARRAAIAGFLQIGGDGFTLLALNRCIRACGVACCVDETGQVNRVRVRFPGVMGVPDGFAQMKIIIEDILPCHLDIWYYFRYCTWGETEEYCLRWRDLAEMTWHGWMVYTVKE